MYHLPEDQDMRFSRSPRFGYQFSSLFLVFSCHDGYQSIFYGRQKLDQWHSSLTGVLACPFWLRRLDGHWYCLKARTRPRHVTQENTVVVWTQSPVGTCWTTCYVVEIESLHISRGCCFKILAQNRSVEFCKTRWFRPCLHILSEIQRLNYFSVGSFDFELILLMSKQKFISGRLSAFPLSPSHRLFFHPRKADTVKGTCELYRDIYSGFEQIFWRIRESIFATNPRPIPCCPTIWFYQRNEISCGPSAIVWNKASSFEEALLSINFTVDVEKVVSMRVASAAIVLGNRSEDDRWWEMTWSVPSSGSWIPMWWVRVSVEITNGGKNVFRDCRWGCDDHKLVLVLNSYIQNAEVIKPIS